ncbi:MAG: hypothetical protein ACTS3F_15120 [Phycisphaerales bacterium]
MRPPKHPHTSQALRHLRNCTFVAMGVFVVALLAQTGVFLGTHLTDAHTAFVTEPEPTSNEVVTTSSERQPSVRSNSSESVGPPTPAHARTDRIEPKSPTSGALVVRGRVINIGTPGSAEQQTAARAQAINTIETPFGLRLRRTSETAQTLGILSALALVVLMLQGVAVSASARVPGVHHVVSSTTWMLLIAGLTVPLAALVPHIPWPGVFTNFDDLLDRSTLIRSGHGQAPSTLGFYAQHLVAPLCCLAGLVAVVFRYNAAIEEGVIVTHSSQLDARVERELRKMGIGHQQLPRSVGALNAAMGADGIASGPDDASDEERPTLVGPRSKPAMPRPI